MRVIADLHIHSKYSRATSKDMNLPEIAEYAKFKGLQLVGVGDFTHPLWLHELKRYLRLAEYGIYEYNNVNFILTTEVCNIYTYNGAVKKIHNIIIVPTFEIAEKVNSLLSGYGNLSADGRPVLSELTCEEMVSLLLDISEECIIIPAHIWTPHFSLYGSNSGFDSIRECFGKNTKYIFSVETGLSSDPKMNWRVKEIDNLRLVSNSDAHSPMNIGRECNVFELNKIEYKEIYDVLKTGDKRKFLYTIEFFPEEGKYHYDGHRYCKVRLHPKDSMKNNNICPVCKNKLTIGVLHRVEEIASYEEGRVPPSAIPYKSFIPLEEIIAKALFLKKGSLAVKREYMNIVSNIAPELNIFLDMSDEEIYRLLPNRIGEGIINMRNGKVKITPGYDGVYGEIDIIFENEGASNKEAEQLTLF